MALELSSVQNRTSPPGGFPFRPAPARRVKIWHCKASCSVVIGIMAAFYSSSGWLLAVDALEC
jgi:hypothetical protein